MASEDPIIFYAIPSYNRPSAIHDKTLALLKREGVADDQITIFVQGPEQVTVYTREVDRRGSSAKIRDSGAPNLVGQRAYIRSEAYPPGSHVVMFDDDIEALVFKRDGMTLRKMVLHGFGACEEHGVHYFGIVGHNNKFYMQDKDSLNLKYVTLNVHGVVTGPVWRDPHWRQEEDQFEDFEFALMYFHRYGKVLRLNWAGIKTKYFAKEGGMGPASGRRGRVAERRAKEIIDRFSPKWVSTVNKKTATGEILNLRLNPHAKPPRS